MGIAPVNRVLENAATTLLSGYQMNHLQIFGVLVLLSVVVWILYEYRKKNSPPNSPKRVVNPRPPSETITLTQSQPINQTIRSTTPYGPVRGIMGVAQPKVGISPREQFIEEEPTESWPPTPPKGAA